MNPSGSRPAPAWADLVARGPLVRVTIGQHPAAAAAAIGLEPNPVPATLLVDTGSQHTIVAPGVIEGLGLEPETYIQFATVTGVLHQSPVYRASVRLHLDDGDVVLHTTVAALPTSMLDRAPFQGLLGRSALRKIRFLYDGPAGRFEIRAGGSTKSP